MDVKSKNVRVSISVEEIAKILEGIKSLFIKKENNKQEKNDDIRLPNFTPFSKEEFGIEDV